CRRIAGLGIGLDRQRAGRKERKQGKPRDNRFHEMAPGSKYRFGVSLELVGLPTGITVALVAGSNRVPRLPRSIPSRLRIIQYPHSPAQCGLESRLFPPFLRA